MQLIYQLFNELQWLYLPPTSQGNNFNHFNSAWTHFRQKNNFFYNPFKRGKEKYSERLAIFAKDCVHDNMRIPVNVKNINCIIFPAYLCKLPEKYHKQGLQYKKSFRKISASFNILFLVKLFLSLIEIKTKYNW